MDHFPAFVITGSTMNFQPLSPLVLLPSLGAATPALSNSISIHFLLLLLWIAQVEPEPREFSVWKSRKLFRQNKGPLV